MFPKYLLIVVGLLTFATSNISCERDEGVMEKEKHSEDSSGQQEREYSWYELGQENPFNKRVLDVRPLTWNVVASTTDKAIAEKYLKLRNSDGYDLVGSSPSDALTTKCDLSYPHNGEDLRGIVFKADSMDVKWDIYIYDSVFYFSRSWSGALIYKARATISDTKIHISSVEYARGAADAELAVQNVHFLIKTHALGGVYPHAIPKSIPDDPEQIAAYSFSELGNKACYATREGILDVTVDVREEENE